MSSAVTGFTPALNMPAMGWYMKPSRAGLCSGSAVVSLKTCAFQDSASPVLNQKQQHCNDLCFDKSLPFCHTTSEDTQVILHSSACTKLCEREQDAELCLRHPVSVLLEQRSTCPVLTARQCVKAHPFPGFQVPVARDLQ